MKIGRTSKSSKLTCTCPSLTMGGSGYNFNISFFDEPEANLFDDPCTSSYGHHLICMNELLENTLWEMDFEPKIFNGIIVTDKWILTSATACLNINNSPWNDYVIRAGTHNLTDSGDDSVIKDSICILILPF